MKVHFDLGDLEKVAKATHALMVDECVELGLPRAPWNRSRIVTAAVHLVVFAPSSAT